MTVAEVTIDTIAAGGDGIGRADGVAVFVPRTAPGDRARVQIDARKRFARGTLEEILTPSPSRVDPVCYHYRVDKCGGCQLQHISYEAQLEAKRGIIRDALTRIGKRPIDLPDVQASDKQWWYRRKLTLAMRREQGDWVIGLHTFGESIRVFQLSDCPITDERVMRTWREVMEARQHFPDADELRASVRLLDESGDASIVMEGGNAWPNRLAFFEAVPSASALWWRPAHRARALVAERGRPAASASFEQINSGVGRALHSYVLDRVGGHRPAFLIDAYAGSGATAIPIAKDGVRVLAIESDRDAVEQCAKLLPAGSRAVAARVEDVIAESLPADVVLINPPRTGVHERVAAALDDAAAATRAVIYVSCDPATLARDLTRMPRYRIASIRGFDMFPQTAHVETVCELVPEAA
ncbi:MAG TPA: TRAM domain-containing protein [Gemmatimonadaceae bacterium]|nr:TRAM domain-containing protein [Gemmatimonadaceae bacterium]